MKKLFLKNIMFSLLAFLFACDTHTNPVKDFYDKTLGFEGNDAAQSIAQTKDGGFIMTGYSNSISNNDDIYLIKTDDRFRIEWSKTIGGSFRDRGYEVRQTADGGYVLVGSLSVSPQNSDVYVIRTNAEGNILWFNKIAKDEIEEGYSIKESADGSFYICGTTRALNSTNSDMLIAKISSGGGSVWTKIYGGALPETIRSLELTHDNGFVVVGNINYNMPEVGDDSINVILLKFNSNGDLQWQKEFDHDTTAGYSKELGFCVKRTMDNGFIIAGSSQILVPINFSHLWGWLIKTDAEGNIQWTRLFDDRNIDLVTSIDQTADGEFVVTGRSGGTSPGRKLYLSKFSSSGSQIWSNVFSGQGSAEGLCVRSVGENIVVAGYTSPIVNRFDGKRDIYIVKTDGAGNIE